MFSETLTALNLLLFEDAFLQMRFYLAGFYRSVEFQRENTGVMHAVRIQRVRRVLELGVFM